MEINICFGINNDYCQHCGCTIASILYNSSPEDKYNFYIISDYISEENKNKFASLKYLRDFKIEYFIINPDEFKDLRTNNNLGISTFFRFRAFDLLKCSKVIYLDADIIVRKNIRELFETDIDGYYCAGVEDIMNPYLKEKFNISPTSLYINAGVMLINLDYCREQNITSRIAEFLTSTWDKPWGDQDIINYIWQDGIKGVDLKWNCLYLYNNYYENQAYYHFMAKDPAIMHYITGSKPWIPGKVPHLKSDYFKYLKLTPWFDDFMILYQIEENSLILTRLEEIKTLINSNK